MSLEKLTARREKLLYRMGKYVEAKARAEALHAECAAELASVTADLKARLAAAQESLQRPGAVAAGPGSVTIGVPTARLGAKSEG